MDDKTAKNGYLYAPVSQEQISKSKSHSLIEAHDQNTSLAQKKLVHTAILPFRLKVKTPSEQIVLSVKKNLKRTNTLRVVKTERRPIIASAVALLPT